MTAVKGDYGIHPTIYADVGDEMLQSMYRHESWERLDENKRQQLLQETVNRAAKLHGEIGACEVVFSSNLGCSTYGVQHDNVIELNRSIFVDEVFRAEYGGHVIEEDITDANFLAYETVLHEDIHAWQNQCINGLITCQDQQLLQEYKANDFSSSFIADASTGKSTLGSQYLNGITPVYGYYLYYFQSTERDAHRESEAVTRRIAEWMQEQYGADGSTTEYLSRIEAQGYDATLKKAQDLFGSPNIEQEINQSLMNHYYGLSVPVDSSVDTLVKKEMEYSFNNQHNISAQFEHNSAQLEDTNEKSSSNYNENDIETVVTVEIIPGERSTVDFSIDNIQIEEDGGLE